MGLDFHLPSDEKIHVQFLFSSSTSQIDSCFRKYFWSRVIYGFTKNSLSRFINLKQSKNEIERNLEQMRAIDNGFLIRTGFVDNTPIGVDTEVDFLQVTKQMKK